MTAARQRARSGAKRGWAAVAQLPAFRALTGDFEVRALTATSLDSAREAAAKHNVPLYFDNHQALVERPEVDLVVVSVKVTDHYGPVEAAIRAGKDVLCEWPLGRNLDQAERLEALARERGVRTFSCTQISGAPYARYVRHLIDSGYVGQVLSTSFVGSISTWGPVAPQGFQDYLRDRTSGGTMLSILGGHSIEALLWELSAVLANQHPKVKRADTGEELDKTAEDHLAVAGTLTNGAVASVHLRGGVSRRGANRLRWTINGTRGDIEVVNTESGICHIGLFNVYGAHDDQTELAELPIPDEFKPDTKGEVKPEDMGYALVEFFRELAVDLRTGRRSVPTFADAVRRHRSLDAIERAAATGQRQTYALA
ncbi:oxidoreductase [Acanthamoeba castellanii str. Neff]|uniref:Oxidoreductase n=1 Tax=Acanthamoeba castellanii (strain ATCC 30010 / Neff) TaxID=1257118 RepID=L8HE03_ACACF|nr:oxidoreductase [Acanthamoeba castellanii str. Neff]ELR23764.1 oxidoreductase [Acanthamoeba castellanii str. Neff]